MIRLCRTSFKFKPSPKFRVFALFLRRTYGTDRKEARRDVGAWTVEWIYVSVIQMREDEHTVQEAIDVLE